MRWFENKTTLYLNYPPYSPGFNLIKYICIYKIRKQHITYPDVAFITELPETIKAQVAEIPTSYSEWDWCVILSKYDRPNVEEILIRFQWKRLINEIFRDLSCTLRKLSFIYLRDQTVFVYSSYIEVRSMSINSYSPSSYHRSFRLTV